MNPCERLSVGDILILYFMSKASKPVSVEPDTLAALCSLALAGHADFPDMVGLGDVIPYDMDAEYVVVIEGDPIIGGSTSPQKLIVESKGSPSHVLGRPYYEVEVFDVPAAETRSKSRELAETISKTEGMVAWDLDVPGLNDPDTALEDDTLEALKFLLAEATPGPLFRFDAECGTTEAMIDNLAYIARTGSTKLHGCMRGSTDDYIGDGDTRVVFLSLNGPTSEANAKLIHFALAALPSLINEVQASRAFEDTLALTGQRYLS